MTGHHLNALLTNMLQLARDRGDEAEWFEFKCDNRAPEQIGEYVSALANSAALAHRDEGYLVWGIENGTNRVTGTAFRPHQEKKGNENLESWLASLLEPRLDFRFHEFVHEGEKVVLLAIPPATSAPVRFRGEEYVRIGGSKRKLRDYPDKEAALWALFGATPLEDAVALSGVSADELLHLVNPARFLDLLKEPHPPDRERMLARLEADRLVRSRPDGRWDLTNLGGLLLAKDLGACRLSRKAVRVVKYKGDSRVETEQEWGDGASRAGYAVAFEAAIAYANSLVPRNELLVAALRTQTTMYPEVAIRELVANALIHQDLGVSGAGPMVEIFSDRVEITNPGEPLIDTQRFIDAPPRTRNEALGGLMRRTGICEERGSGIDKVIRAVELFQLPAPRFEVAPGSTRVTLYGQRPLGEMDAADRVRACYQHACLQYVCNRTMTNSSIRERFGLGPKEAPKASRMMREAVEAGLIRLRDPDASRRDRVYVPFWA
jgi:ATP-dependent DNA helicase RecG